jgi:hypothetical protein
MLSYCAATIATQTILPVCDMAADAHVQKESPPTPAPPAGALIFEDSHNIIGGLQSMRCSSCRQVKPVHADAPGGFPPSCAKWRRGPCRACRAAAARGKSAAAKKLENARHRFGSVRSVTVRDIENLLEDAGLGEEDIGRYRLDKRDSARPFAADNLMWVSVRQLCV